MKTLTDNESAERHAVGHPFELILQPAYYYQFLKTFKILSILQYWQQNSDRITSAITTLRILQQHQPQQKIGRYYEAP